MPQAPIHQMGAVIGQWRLLQFLPGGSNGEVWEVVGPQDERAAIKILKRKKGDAYPRFRAEIGLLSRLGNRQGLLPLMDHSLPEAPSKSAPAWFVMPLAQPLREALGSAPGLDEIVSAVAGIAETLAWLHEQGITHRDIKPNNLYMFDGFPTIGDFGLASYPEKEAITQGGKQLGPLYFLAPEMIEHPDRVEDAGRADVYSLAKTLYVLVSGQNFPPQGPQRMDDPSVDLGQWTTHPDKRLLGQLIERATENSPSRRPAMQDFAAELRAWLRPVVAPVRSGDLSYLKRKVAKVLEPGREAAERATRRGQDLRSLVRRVVLPLVEFQKDLYAADIDRTAFAESASLFGPGELEAPGSTRYGCELRCSGPGVTLRSGLSAELDRDDKIWIIAGHVLDLTGTGNSDVVVWRESLKGSLGTTSLERDLVDLIGKLTENQQKAAESLVEHFSGVSLAARTVPPRDFKLRNIMRDTPGRGELLIVFTFIDEHGDEQIRNCSLFVGMYDPAILVSDVAIECAARIQVALNNTR